MSWRALLFSCGLVAAGRPHRAAPALQNRTVNLLNRAFTVPHHSLWYR